MNSSKPVNATPGPDPLPATAGTTAADVQQHINAIQQHIQNAAPGSQGLVDVASILSKIQSLEQEKAELNQQLTMKDAKLDKLTESKRVEMQQLLETTISKFLEDLQMRDTKTKEDLRAGLERLAKRGDETGVWEVMACASSAHVARVTELESLRTEVNTFREREKALQGGVFGAEDTRLLQEVGSKRKIEEISTNVSVNGVPDIFEEFSKTIMSEGGINACFAE